MSEISINIKIPAFAYAICDDLAEIRSHDSAEQYIAKLVTMNAFKQYRIMNGETIEDYSVYEV